MGDEGCWRVQFRVETASYNLMESSVTLAPNIDKAIDKVRKAEAEKIPKREIFILNVEFLGTVL